MYLKNKSRIFNSKNALKSIAEFLSKELHESGLHALLGLEIQPRYEALVMRLVTFGSKM